MPDLRWLLHKKRKYQVPLQKYQVVIQGTSIRRHSRRIANLSVVLKCAYITSYNGNSIKRSPTFFGCNISGCIETVLLICTLGPMHMDFIYVGSDPIN